MDFDPTKFGATPVTTAPTPGSSSSQPNFDPTAFGATPVDTSTPTPASTSIGGLGSDTVNSYQEYGNQTPAQFVANDAASSHAIFPANQNEVSDITDVPQGGGLKSVPAIAGGVAKGIGSAALNAAKGVPNYFSDLFMNVIPGIAGLAKTAALLPWDYGKGLLTGDMSDFANELHNGIVGQVWRDPTVLAGSATRAVVFGVGQGLQKFWNGDTSGGLTDISQGIQNGVTAFENAPMSNIIAFKALGGVADAVANPIDTLKGITDKTVATAHATLHPVDFMKENMPESLKMYTKAGQQSAIDATEAGIEARTELLKKTDDMTNSLTSNEENPEKDALTTKLNNANDALKENYQQQNILSQATLAATESGLKIASPTNPDAIITSISKVADDTNHVSTQGYQDLLPKTTPNYQPLLDSFKEFLNKADTLNDSETVSKFQKYYNDLKSRVALNDAWNQSGGDKQTFIKSILKPDSGIDYEDGIKFAENPNAPEYRLPNTVELKANSKGVLNGIKENSSVTNTKAIYNETIGKALNDTIDSEVLKGHGQEGLDAYHKADTQWGNAQELARKVVGPAETAKDTTAETKIMNNIDTIDKISPQTGDTVRSYFANKILDSARDGNGYDADKILKGVNTYRDVLRQSDKDLFTEQATQISDAQKGIADIAAKNAVIGGTPIEMAQKIGQITTLADLDNFSKLSGKTPEELGSIYRQNAYETALKNVDDITTEDGKMEAVKQFLSDEKKLGGKTPESKAVYDQMTPTDTKVQLANMRQEMSYYDKLKATKPTTISARFIKAAAGTIFFAMGHTFFGSSLLIRGALPDTLGDLSKPEPITSDEEGNLTKEKPETPPKKGIIKKVASLKDSNTVKAGGVQANANENAPKGDAVTQEEADELGLPDSMVGVYTDAHLKADLESDTPPDWFTQIAQDKWPNLDEKDAWAKMKQQ